MKRDDDKSFWRMEAGRVERGSGQTQGCALEPAGDSCPEVPGWLLCEGTVI